jgi:nucleotide-binding universal stress UspA family protein
MVSPEGVESSGDMETIAIAWDGGRSASRAVHDAMPLITKARKAVLLTAYSDKEIGEASVAELSAYLDRHGVATSHHDVSSPGKVLGAAFQTAAHENGAGLLVIGAFGHSRLRDFVLGGVTRDILHELKMPVFLSH